MRPGFYIQPNEASMPSKVSVIAIAIALLGIVGLFAREYRHGSLGSVRWEHSKAIKAWKARLFILCAVIFAVWVAIRAWRQK